MIHLKKENIFRSSILLYDSSKRLLQNRFRCCNFLLKIPSHFSHFKNLYEPLNTSSSSSLSELSSARCRGELVSSIMSSSSLSWITYKLKQLDRAPLRFAPRSTVLPAWLAPLAAKRSVASLPHNETGHIWSQLVTNCCLVTGCHIGHTLYHRNPMS